MSISDSLPACKIGSLYLALFSNASCWLLIVSDKWRVQISHVLTSLLRWRCCHIPIENSCFSATTLGINTDACIGNLLQVLMLILDGASFILVCLVLEDKLFVKTVVWRVGATVHLVLGLWPLEVICMLAEGGTSTRERNVYLGNELLFPRDNVLLRIHLIPDVLRMLESLQIFFMCVLLQCFFLVKCVSNSWHCLISFLMYSSITFAGDVFWVDCSRSHKTAWIIVRVKLINTVVPMSTEDCNVVGVFHYIGFDAFVRSDAKYLSTRS